MQVLDQQFAELGAMEALARQDSPVHRLDPRAKLVTTLAFVIAVVSCDRYSISGLLPFLLYPTVLATVGRIPAGCILRKLAVVSPFALLVGVLNPCLDRTPLLSLGGVAVSGGWVSFLSILLRFGLTLGATLVLLACTGVYRLSLAAESLGVPSVFVMQVLFLYRYLFVLWQEALRMVRAILLRSPDQARLPMAAYTQFLGTLLLRTLARAERIHTAMRCRGFTGQVCLLQPLRLRVADVLFCAGWVVCFLAFRFGNVAQRLGSLITEGYR